MTTSRRGPRSLPSWLTRTMSPSGSAGCSMPSSGGGAAVDVLCLTHGEASTLHGVDGNLLAVRESELTAAADLLGVSHAWLRNHRDGALGEVDPEILTGAVLDVARGAVPQGLLVFDTTGITGHPDHVAASAAAVRPPRHWTFRCWAGWCPHPSQRSSTASSAPALSDVPRRRSTCRSRWTAPGSCRPAGPTPAGPCRRASCGGGWNCWGTPSRCDGCAGEAGHQQGDPGIRLGRWRRPELVLGEAG